jgi:hypothetical protein
VAAAGQVRKKRISYKPVLPSKPQMAQLQSNLNLCNALALLMMPAAGQVSQTQTGNAKITDCQKCSLH